MSKLDRIIAAGRKLAAQLGATFSIDPRKLRDFEARERSNQVMGDDNSV